MLHINTDYSKNQELFARIQKALALIYSGKLDDLAVGKYPFEDGMYYMAQAYESKEFGGEYEAHVKMVDIQYVVSGKEQIRMAPLEDLTVTRPYNPDKDVLFGTADSSDTVYLNAHDAVVLMPDEGHAPQIQWDGPCAVRKIVFKIPV